MTGLPSVYLPVIHHPISELFEGDTSLLHDLGLLLLRWVGMGCGEIMGRIPKEREK